MIVCAVVRPCVHTGSVFLVWLGQIIAVALGNWLHQQVAAGTTPPFTFVRLSKQSILIDGVVEF